MILPAKSAACGYGRSMIVVLGDAELRRDRLPQLLGDERDQRVQQRQQAFEHVQQRVARAVGRGGVVAVQCRLGELDEPVAEVVPGELVQRLRQQVEAVGGEVLLGFGGGLRQLREDPALGIGAAAAARRVKLRAFGVHQHEARGVPQLVAEVLVALGAAQVELDVAAVASPARRW